ncbi:MAG: hypothetical protein ACO0C9_05385 [Candidatus Methanosuratincola verstraetei]|uniref:Uncharacterized protein n=2 Tax=Candidatus Methanosuratincola (ex Vanwonterghem et al. 2016) TaxID=1915412 RepID=A0A7J3UYB9_9CREN|nr:MAG: hypothetical protein Metus_1196 [Candidatus Methanosuratincola subterraneus]
MVNLVSVIINLVVSIIILSPVLWLVGRWLAGKDKAKFTDAIWIVVIGTIVDAVFGYFDLGLIGAIIMIIIWLALIKHFFDCGWLRALLVAIVTVVVFIIIGIVLALLGFALLAII